MRRVLVVAAALALAGCGDAIVASPEPAPAAFDCPDGVPCRDCDTARPFPGSLQALGPPGLFDPADPVWGGWMEQQYDSRANNNGVTYRMEARWNIPTADPVASIVMVTGRNNGNLARVAWFYAAELQDALAADGIRTVCVRYVGGSDQPPTNGWPSISAPFADVVGWLRAAGVLEGRLLAYGNSGGSCIVANALVNQVVPLDGVILGGGPFGTDFAANGCPIGEIEAYAFGDVPGGCASASPLLRACRSLVGPDSRTLLPGVDVVVLVGTQDDRRAFITGEAQGFLDRIRAGSEGFGSPVAGHSLLNYTGGRDAVLFHARRLAGL